ncbi:hypothetical protein [Mediterraneibacter agrestimuris]|uniref:hypothetical protein n=1 Tax=Mediterraneibacter agrestimuris TaxID=2941333 RepID=UPI002040D376|nr:hypothetical protein [Mediterraneibacter agrestimuris]
MAKRMKRILAIAAVCVLTLSMGTAVFAASPIDPDIPDGIETPDETEKPDETDKPSKPVTIVGGTAVDKDGNSVTVKYAADVAEEVKEILKDDEQVRDILENNGYIPEDKGDITVIGVGDIELPEGAMPEGGIDLSIPVTGDLTNDLNEGDTVYVLHQKHDGTWEVLEGKVSSKDANGVVVDAHFDSLSPIAIIKVMSDGKAVIMDKDGENKQPIIPPTQDEVDDETDKDDDAKTENKADNKTESGKNTAAKAENNSGVKLSPKTGK